MTLPSPLETSWQRTWPGVGAGGIGVDARDDWIARDSEPWRKYHTLQHLRECLVAFETALPVAARPAEVEAGLWFHDAVYDVHRTDNEERSARLAERVLTAAAIASEVVSRVSKLVLVTRHTALPTEPDEQLLVDIDLAILGSEPPRFAEYERQIREEYSFVPDAVFHEKRKAILRSFIERPTIFSTDHFRRLLEQRARLNISSTLGDRIEWPA